MINHVLIINQSFTIYHVMMIYHSPFYPPIKSDNGEYSCMFIISSGSLSP